VTYLLLLAPAALTLGGSRLVRVEPSRAARIALTAFGVQVSLLLLAWVLLAFLPDEGNREGGTCWSYRRSELDEIVAGLGWASALISGAAFAGSMVASRRTQSHGRWLALAAGSLALPYAVFASYIYGGLCYALDT
jgi:hypothetical protein